MKAQIKAVMLVVAACGVISACEGKTTELGSEVIDQLGESWPSEPVIQVPSLRRPQQSGAYNRPIPIADFIYAVRSTFQRDVAAILASNAPADVKQARIIRRREEIRELLAARRTKAWSNYYYWGRSENKASKKNTDRNSNASAKCKKPTDVDLSTSRARTAYYRRSSGDPDKGWGDVDRLRNGSWHGGNRETTPNAKTICAPKIRRSGVGVTMIRAFAIFRYPAAIAARKGKADANAVVSQIG